MWLIRTILAADEKLPVLRWFTYSNFLKLKSMRRIFRTLNNTRRCVVWGRVTDGNEVMTKKKKQNDIYVKREEDLILQVSFGTKTAVKLHSSSHRILLQQIHENKQTAWLFYLPTDISSGLARQWYLMWLIRTVFAAAEKLIARTDAI